MSKVTKEELIQAIYGQESSHGKADTSEENYARARGPMQVTAPTFDGLKKLGLIPQEYDHANPAHTKEAGDKLVGYLYDKYDGDARKVAAAYYAGEKAVQPDGTIRNFVDRKNAKAPTTHEYVADIEKRLTGVSTVASASALPAPTVRPDVLDSWTVGMPDRELRASRPVATKDTTPDIGPMPADQTTAALVPEGDRVAAIGERLSQEQAVRDSTSVLDVARSKVMHEGMLGAVLSAAVRPEFKPSPGGFQVDPKELAGLDEDEQEFMREAVSPEHLARIKWEIQEGREQREIGARRGLGVNLLASAVVGAPTDYATGMGVFKLFTLGKVASGAYAAQGRAGTALASAAAENAIGGAATTGVAALFDKHTSAADIAIDMAASALLGPVLSSPSILREAASGARAQMQAMADNAAAEVLKYREQALKNLGENATPEQLTLEAQRLESNAIRQTVSAGRGEVPSNRRLIDEEEPLRPDAPEASTQKIAVGEGQPTAAGKFPSEKPQWDKGEVGSPEVRNLLARNDEKWMAQIAEVEGMSMAAADKVQGGLTVLPKAQASVMMRPAISAINTIFDNVRKSLPAGTKLIVGVSSDTVADGKAISIGNTHFIGLADRGTPSSKITTGMHEVGHVVFHATAKDIPQPLLSRMVAEHAEFIKELRAGKASARFKRFSEGSESVISPEGTLRGTMDDTAYTASFDEYTAEAFTRFMQRKAREEGSGLKFDAGVVALLKSAWEQVKRLWELAKSKGYLPNDEPFEEYFQAVLDGTLKQQKALPIPEKAPEYLDAGLIANFNQRVDPAQRIVEDPVAIKHGLSLLPVETPAQQAEVRAITALYKKAEQGGYAVDEKRLSKLLNTAVFQGAQGTANVMLRSENPVVRMVAAELLESASGAGGRRSNAAIAKHLNERAYLGNALNEVQDAYRVYRTAMGETVAGDFFNGKTWDQFNRRVAEEIESRQPGAASIESAPAVKRAADVLEAAYERMRTAQTTAKTIGWASLPESSKGYMPHRMSPEKVRAMTQAQQQALHSALVDQFISIDGFDITFAENLSRKYMDRVRQRALGGFDAPVGVHQVGAADIVEDALEAMGMERQQVIAMMKKYMAGAAGHTKKRLKLDLNAEHAMEDGTTFKLMDLFETDQFRLLRSQAQRVSGEVALARHGVMGKSGLKLLKRAMEFGEDGKLATKEEIEAFDQVAAEFMGEPFGTQSKFVDRAMQVNSLARLGGMGFTQFAEAINGVFHVGAARTMSAVGSMGRLRSEIKALARGEKVDNPILNSIEQFGGAEFGTDSYKTVFPFDNGSLQYQTYGRETITAADRLLRGAGFVQGRLSFWRSIHSAQQRGFAEQIVRKAATFLRDGSNDVALRDMGISDELMGKLRADLPNIAKFDGDRLTDFDITMASDKAAAEEFVQAVHRGTSQIIQGTFIGEQGRWAHDSIMRLMTQFRTFGLTSIDKQWSRQVGNVGTAKVLGMMLGAMTLAAPIYMARTYLASVGRPDQEEYLERQLSNAQIARATLNYIAMSGLAGDFLDAATAVTGVGKATGGRTGASSEFVGNVVAPAAGLADDLWRGLQNTKEGTDPYETVKSLPFSKLPFLIPAINALDE